MKKKKYALSEMIIFVSVDGEDPWDPVLVNEVPKWLTTNPDHMAELHSGMMARQQKDVDGPWYRAELRNIH